MDIKSERKTVKMSEKSTRRALWASGMSILLCVTILIVTTLAWFSDVISNKGNRIQAGSLKVAFAASNEYDDTDTNNLVEPIRDLADPGNKLFNIDNAAPGEEHTIYMRVKNIGSLALDYDIDFVLSGANDALASAILVNVEAMGGTVAPNGAGAPTVTDGADVVASQAASIKMSGSLDETDYYQIFKVTLKFMDGAGNTYNSIEGDLDFGLDVILTASQKDKPKPVKVGSLEEFEAALVAGNANKTIVFTKDIKLDGSLTIAGDVNVNIDGNGYTLDMNGNSITFGQTNSYVTCDINGHFVNGEIILNNTNGHFNIHGLTGTTATILAQHTANSSANVTGTWGALTVGEENVGKTIVNATIPSVTIKNTAPVIFKEESEVGTLDVSDGADVVSEGATIDDITGNGKVKDEQGIPLGAIIVYPGTNIYSDLYDKDNSNRTYYLMPGTHVLNNAYIRADNVTLMGAGVGKTFIDVSGGVVNGYGLAFIEPGAKNCTMTDFTIVRGTEEGVNSTIKISTTTSNALVKNVNVVGGKGIDVNGSTNVVIDNVNVKDSVGYGISVSVYGDPNTELTVRNTKISNCSWGHMGIIQKNYNGHITVTVEDTLIESIKCENYTLPNLTLNISDQYQSTIEDTSKIYSLS